MCRFKFLTFAGQSGHSRFGRCEFFLCVIISAHVKYFLSQPSIGQAYFLSSVIDFKLELELKIKFEITHLCVLNECDHPADFHCYKFYYKMDNFARIDFRASVEHEIARLI